VLVDPMDAMARLQLARALALSGDTAKAKRAYEDLFALWKDADPEIPIVNEARAEHAKLQCARLTACWSSDDTRRNQDNRLTCRQ
jgi:hypothetical protein